MSDEVLHTSLRGDVLQTTLDVLQTVGSEAILRLGKDGLDVALVDPANVYMVRLSVEPAAFEKVPGGQFAIGINLESLSDHVSKANADDVVTLAFAPETGKLNVQYGHVDSNLAGIDTDSIRQEPDVPDLDLPSEVELPTSELENAVDMAELVSDHISVGCETDPDALHISADGDTEDTSYRITSDEMERTAISEATTALYSLEYVNSLTTACVGETVTLRLGDEFPMKAFSEYADGEATVEAMIAPRIQS